MTVAMYKVRLLPSDPAHGLYLKTVLERGGRVVARSTCRAARGRAVIDLSRETRFPLAKEPGESIVMSIKKERGIGLRSKLPHSTAFNF